MAFDLCVIPASVVPYLSALQTRKFSITDITAHLVSEKLTREQCRLMTPDTFASSHALHVRSSVSSEINLAITSSVSENAPSGYTIVIQGCLNDHNSHNIPIVLGVCVSDEPIVADASLRMFVNIEETNNVFRLRADFDGMVTQGLLDDILEQSLEAYPTIALYNSSTKKITFKNVSNTELPNMEIDASAFIKDGMVKDVVIQNGNLVVSFNTDAGKEDISIPLSSIFDSGNYYTKTQTDTQISTAIDALALGDAAKYDVDTFPIVDASSGNLVTTISMTQWVRSQIQDASDYIKSIIPSVHNATLTIKKSADVSGDTFTANASSNKTIDLDLGDAADKNVDTSIVNASSVNLPTVEAVTGWVSSQLRGYAQSSDIPTVGNATITIQKRSGTSAGDFTTNATANKTINLSLGAAADKEVDTSISSTSSTNLPTSSAVAEWVNAQTGNFVTLDTQQTISGSKTFSETSEFTGDVYVTGYDEGGLRFADTNSLQTTAYVRIHGNCSSTPPEDTYSGIEVEFYVDPSVRHSLSLKDTKIISKSSTSYDLSITPSESNICTLGSPENEMKAIYATTYYGTMYYGLAEQLYGTGVGSLYLIKFKAVNTSEKDLVTYSRGEILKSKTSCKISAACNVTVFNGSGSTTSTTSSSGYCLYMYDGDYISDGVNGAFRLLNRIAIPASSTRYFLALVVRVS